MSFTTVVYDNFWTILSIFLIKESCCAFNKACMYEILCIIHLNKENIRIVKVKQQMRNSSVVCLSGNEWVVLVL